MGCSPSYGNAPSSRFLFHHFLIFSSECCCHLGANCFQSSTNLLDNLVSLSSTMLSYHRQQRVLTHPVVVHCLNGSGKTAVFILLAAAMAEINLAGGHSENIIPDLVRLSSRLYHPCLASQDLCEKRPISNITYIASISKFLDTNPSFIIPCPCGLTYRGLQCQKLFNPGIVRNFV